jgi:hypothetical protein
MTSSTPGQLNATTHADAPPVGAVTGRWVVYAGSVVDAHGLAWRPYPHGVGLCSSCDISDPELEGRSCLAALDPDGGWYWLHTAGPESFTPAPEEN